MSLLQTDLPADAISRSPHALRADQRDLRSRTPTGAEGAGRRHAKKSRAVNEPLGRARADRSAFRRRMPELGIPADWSERCEDSAHVGHDDTHDALAMRLEKLLPSFFKFDGEGLAADRTAAGTISASAKWFTSSRTTRTAGGGSLWPRRRRGRISLALRSAASAINWRRAVRVPLQGKFSRWDIPLPGGDRELVYAPLGTPEADAYLGRYGRSARISPR